MSLSQSILNYVNALKWPVVVAGGTYYFRKPFSKILEQIALAHKGAISGPAGTSITWDNTLREVDAALGQVATVKPASGSAGGGQASPPPKPPGHSPVDDDWTTIAELLDAFPAGAVVLAQTQVHHALRIIAHKSGVHGAEAMGTQQLTEVIELPENIKFAIAELSKLRSDVLHRNARPSQRDAEEYVASAWRLCEFLQGIERNISPDAG